MSYDRIFLDSGAFSCKRKGMIIDINEYIRFIKKHEDKLTVYANLDVIGDWKATWQNQEIMENAGLHPLPVHHMEDPIECLHRCMKYDHMALGGMAGGSPRQRETYFNKVWDIICDKDGFPKVKVHGFGMAAPYFVYKYPWWSVDSQSWAAFGRFGMVLTPKVNDDGSYAWNEAPWNLFVSDESPRMNKEGLHFNTLTKPEQEYFLKYLKMMDIPFGDSNTLGVKNSNFHRDLANFFYYAYMFKSIPEYPWAWKRPKHPKTLFEE